MEAVRLFQFAARWLVVPLEAAAWLWLAALLLALLGWVAWGTFQLYADLRQAVVSYAPDQASRAGLLRHADRPAMVRRTSSQAPAGRPLQKLSVQGRSSTSQLQALRGWRRTSR